jgi:hypothetical protein
MMMKKYEADDFFNDIDYGSIVDTIKGIYTSDGTINLLLDFERVLDEADLYAFKNWELGELVAGPTAKKYTVSCIFMYPEKLMPDPRGGKRLLGLNCVIKFKKTKIKVPVQIKSPEDYKDGTHYPKHIERTVWLVYIEMPKELMNDIREGSIDLADQTIDLEELDNAYEEDLDTESNEDEDQAQQAGGMAAVGDLGGGGSNAMGAPVGPAI